MSKSRGIAALSCLCLLLLAAPAAQAQWAVVDAPAIAQLIQEVRMLQQALATARSQLQQAEQTLQSMSGGRGMQGLLAGTVRNYLPADWNSVAALPSGGGGGTYTQLAAGVQALIGAQAVLPPGSLAQLAPGDRQLLIASRQRIATDQALFRGAFANASGRFAAIQSLIDAIATATDQKGILDLQARIGAENGMLQNEQTKLLVLAQAMQAQNAAAGQQLRESIIAGQGRFETRFRPAP
ncbi:MAG TPA: type IV secretion system protein [Steroidobacteraceae bacterium]|nr:type IV secretion system protein [Steroidobacteraceae bacterium]